MSKIDKVTKLEPYKSLVLAQIDPSAQLSSLIDDCLDDIRREEILDIYDEDEKVDESEERVRKEKTCKSGVGSSTVNLEHGFFHYELQKPVSWTNSDNVRDTENHLVLFSRKRNVNLLALYASENSRRRSIRKNFGKPEYEGLCDLSPIDPAQMNDAFFGDQVRTLWLSGMHRRVPVKADAKVLSGQDLEYALDPVNDQTFYFSAVRSSSVSGPGETEDNGEEDSDDDDRDQRDPHNELRTVGLSPKKSRIWTRPSRNWSHYLEGTNAILSVLGNTLNSDDKDEDRDEPLPVLADVAAENDDIGAPYDMVIQPPELLGSSSEQEEDESRKDEEWAYNAHFELLEGTELGDDFDLIDDPTPPNVVSDVYHRGDKIGRVAIELDVNDQTNVQIETVETAPDDEEDDEQENRFKTLKKLCRSTRKLKVYYDSGHTLSGGTLYSIQFQNRPFDQFLWASFGDNYNITKEKPSDFPKEGDDVDWDGPPNGEGEDDENGKYSLFHWVYENWPPDRDSWTPSDAPREWKKGDGPEGWLAIDDGSMEIADFIHFREPEDDDDKPVLSLIHVKGSGSDSTDREISVANYEVVTGQAVKNLRHLETTNLAEELKDGADTKVGTFVWKDGAPVETDDSDEDDTPRSRMADVLEKQNSDFQRRVVVLQPHIRGSYYKAIREGDDGQNKMRLRQLDALLNGARQSCNGLGAEFWVVAAKA
jgi:hypothetical protein